MDKFKKGLIIDAVMIIIAVFVSGLSVFLFHVLFDNPHEQSPSRALFGFTFIVTFGMLIGIPIMKVIDPFPIFIGNGS